MNEPLLAWMAHGKEHWRPNVINFTRGQLELRELRGRAITRDLDWGITIPIGDYPDKRIYVWYDAVIGYLSAAIEWAKLSGARRRGASGGTPTSTPTRISTTSSARTTSPSTPSSGRAC
jgi:methionyl-tRNA synthetase